MQLLSTGRMVRAEVWLAVKIRRMSMITFMISLVLSHQRDVKVSPKPSPTFRALFDSELAQYKSLTMAKLLAEDSNSNDTNNNSDISNNVTTFNESS